VIETQKTYADVCLERAERMSEGEDAEFIAHARTDVPELARRLKMACDSLAILKGVIQRKMPVHPDWVQELIDELEAMPGEENPSPPAKPTGVEDV
jgi:hypothetical protein